MIEIVVCDDQPQAILSLQTSLQDYFSMRDKKYHLVTFSRPSVVYDYMAEHTVHILFMDLEFSSKEEDGILWSRKIHSAFPNTLVLILTAYEARYKEGYVARAYRFMTKPLIPQEFEENMDSCLDELLAFKSVKIARHNITYRVLLKDIFYVEAYAGGIALYTANNTFYCDESLLHWENTLPTSLFFRCHKKYLISLSHIKTVEKHTVVLDNDKKLPVSRRKWTALQTTFIKFNVR